MIGPGTTKLYNDSDNPQNTLLLQSLYLANFWYFIFDGLKNHIENIKEIIILMSLVNIKSNVRE